MYLIDKVPEIAQKGLQEKTIQLLKTTQEPRYAYIVCEMRKVVRMEGEKKVTKLSTGLAFLNVQDQADQEYNLHDYINNRGGKVICYGNFPNGLSLDERARQKYTSYSEPNSQNPWDKMAAICEKYMKQGNQITELESQLNEKTTKLEQELEYYKAKLGEKDNGSDTKGTKGENGASTSGSIGRGQKGNGEKESGTKG